MKLYEAETDGRITKIEREAIAKKYSDQIREMQGKLKDVELVVEVGELQALREELVSMFQDKIRNLEARLDSATERLGAAAPQAMAQIPSVPQARREQAPRSEKGPELEKVVEKRAKPEMSESEKRVKDLRNEVLEALTKLERIDVEKKQQET
jgi:septum formation inhibitor MinC